MFYIRGFLISLILIFLTACSGKDDKRQALLKHCREIYHEASDDFMQCPGTQLEITGLSGNLWRQIEGFLYQAAEYRIKNNPLETQNILRDIFELGRDVDCILNASWENTGSIEAMNRYVRVSFLVNRQVEILLAPPERYARWQRFKSAEGTLRGQYFHLHNGKAFIQDNCFGEEVELELMLLPQFCFTLQDSEYAVMNLDLPQSNTACYFTQYLGQLKQQKIEIIDSLGESSEKGFEFKDELLILHHKDGSSSSIDLSKQ